MNFLYFCVLGQTIQHFTSPNGESFTNVETSITALREVPQMYTYEWRLGDVVMRFLYRANA